MAEMFAHLFHKFGAPQAAGVDALILQQCQAFQAYPTLFAGWPFTGTGMQLWPVVPQALHGLAIR